MKTTTPSVSASHAPGPLVVKTRANGESYISDSNGEVIAEVYYERDARLLAAAPELLAALELIAKGARPGFAITRAETKQIARAAIAKAKSQPLSPFSCSRWPSIYERPRTHPKGDVDSRLAQIQEEGRGLPA